MGRGSGKRLTAAALIRWKREVDADRTEYKAELAARSRLPLESVLGELWRKLWATIDEAYPDGQWNLIICEVWPEIGLFALYPATHGYYLGDTRLVASLRIPSIGRTYDKLPDAELKPESFDQEYDKLLGRMSEGITSTCEQVLADPTCDAPFAVYLVDSPEVVHGKDLVWLRGKKISPRLLNQEPKKKHRQPSTSQAQATLDRLQAEYKANFPTETNVHIAAAQPDDTIIELLRELPALETLNISPWKGSFITDAGVAKLNSFSKLKHLLLAKSQVTSRCADTLARMPQLEMVVLSETAIDNGACAKLARLKLLRFLRVAKTSVGDAGVRHLAKLENLEWLDLNSTQVTNKAMSYLSGHSKLATLCVENTKVTDAGISQLRTVKHLKEVKIAGSGVTPAGILALSKRFPKLIVDRTRVGFWLKQRK